MRLCTPNLKTYLDLNWNNGENFIIGDMYEFSMITGEVFRFSNLQVPVLAEVPAGQIVTSTATPPGSSTININTSSLSAALSRWCANGQLIFDYSNPTSGCITPGTTVSGFDAVNNTYITMSADAIGGGIPAGETLSFQYYYELGPRFSRTKTKTQVGPQIDEMEVDLLVSNADVITLNNTSNITWQEASFFGLFDGGYMKLNRAFFVTNPGVASLTGTCVGSVTWFYGRISDITIGRTKVTIKVKSLIDLITIQMPRRLYQSSCGWIFGAPGCDYNRTLGQNALGVSTGYGQVGITCLAGSNQSFLVTTFVPGVATAYDNGTMISTSGANNGYTRTIGMLVDGGLYFLKPWLFPVVAGTDTFTLLPGCDHTLPTCTSVFQNESRYGGFPYVPPPETAV